MKSGELVLYDIAAASIVETVEAHSGTVWSLHVRPDFGGVVTGSADKDVKFWDFEDKEVPESVSNMTKSSEYQLIILFSRINHVLLCTQKP